MSAQKNALVTGGSRGIGKGIALALAGAGYKIVICHHEDATAAQSVAEQIQAQFGRSCTVFECDLTKPDSPKRLVEQALQVFEQIDVLVNNAGITIFSDIVTMNLSDMDRLIHLDFRAPLLMMQTVGEHMISKGIHGSIVNITSSRSERAYPADAVYGGMKAALARATQSIALEFAPHHIRVNCIAPGAIQVRDENQAFYQKLGEKIPLGRVGEPMDVGQAVVWLSSEQASYITGASIRIDGGLILPGMPEDRDAGNGWGKVKR